MPLFNNVYLYPTTFAEVITFQESLDTPSCGLDPDLHLPESADSAQAPAILHVRVLVMMTFI